MEFRGEVAVVTGAASGIGEALARELGVRGAQLVLADSDPEGLQRVASELGADHAVVDVADPMAMDRLAEMAGDARLVCLNAGVISSYQEGPVWQAPLEEWRRVFDVNLFGVVNGLRAFAPEMADAGGRRDLLITASLAGLLTWPTGGPYAASKQAVMAVAEQAAMALEQTQVRVTALCPALVRTGMSDVGADPTDIAIQALDAVAAGTFVVVDELWTDAVRTRAQRRTTGDQPEPPQPTDR